MVCKCIDCNSVVEPYGFTEMQSYVYSIHTHVPYLCILNAPSLCSEFIGNGGGRGGTLSIAYFPIIFKGNVTFVNNTGPAFRVSIYTLYLTV